MVSLGEANIEGYNHAAILGGIKLLGEDERHKDAGVILMQTLEVKSAMLDESDL